MQLASTFDILGPVMVGPSSSHTAGALRIAQLAASLAGAPVTRVAFTLYNSFAKTYRGHGTDRALVAGILGLSTDDPRIPRSFELARERGLAFEFTPSAAGEGLHPNTVDIDMLCADGSRTCVRGESVGGGRMRVVRVNGVDVELTGRMPTTFVAHRDTPGMLAVMTGELGAAGVNIAYMSSYRTTPGKLAYAVFETDTAPSPEVVERIAAHPDVYSAQVVRIPHVRPVDPSAESPLDFTSGAELLALAQGRSSTLGALMRAREEDLRGAAETTAQMGRVLEVMRAEVSEPVRTPERSMGGMIGGEAARLAGCGEAARLCGPTVTRANVYALATLERSAAMGVIVAAPTAGSAGVVPACVLAASEELGSTEEEVEEALFAAAAVGAVIERNASVAGAEGGCQAEVGSAAAMAAAAVAQLQGADPSACLDAATLAIQNMLGLVCDPVRGLVEVPCQTRNVIGVADALTAAQLAVAGVRSPIPFDEAVEAARQVGHALPESLRETAMGGLAVAPSVCGDACRACS